MPDIKFFPQEWVFVLKHMLHMASQGTFLRGIPELAVLDNSGNINKAFIPYTDFHPKIKVTDGSDTVTPQMTLTSEGYTKEATELQLKMYDTIPTKLTDNETIGATYDYLKVVAKAHADSIASAKLINAIHDLSPKKSTDNNGKAVRATISAGDTKFINTYNAICDLTKKADMAGWPTKGRRLVLCAEHYNKMLKDRERFADILLNRKDGDPAPKIAGWEIYTYAYTPTYGDGDNTMTPLSEVMSGDALPTLAPAGSGKKRASVAFLAGNVAMKTGLTKAYFTPAASDPENKTTKISYRTYFGCKGIVEDTSASWGDNAGGNKYSGIILDA